MAEPTPTEGDAPLVQPSGPPSAQDVPRPDAPSQQAGEAPAPRGGEGSPAPAAPPKAEAKPKPPRPTAVVRYGLMRHTGEFRHNLKAPPARSTKVVLRTERGVELGEVITPVGKEDCFGCISAPRLREFTRANGPDYPFRRDGRILRLANPQDVIDYRHLEQSAREAAVFCRQQIAELQLDMKLVTVEHLLGGERIVFYFSAEHRVDFREMVRRLASQYRTRIEMRQVGARDEARLVADYERCGQQCCCQSFLKDLKPVSMRMAKTQKATLDPSKISGRCGRLMCCLRYEDTAYEELRKKLPRRNTWVRTEELVGKVVETQILTQLVRLQLPDNSRVAVAVEDIVERSVEPPPKPAPAPVPARRARGRRQPPAREAKPAPAPPPAQPKPAQPKPEPSPPPPVAAPQAQAPGEEGQPPPPKKRRRRRRPRRKGAAQGHAPAHAEPDRSAEAPPPSPEAKAQAAPAAGGRPAEDKHPRKHKPRRRRPRRRRKK